MKKFNKTLILLLSLLFIISLSSCDSETEEINKGNIRGAVKLTTNDIPALEGATETRGGEKPWIWKAGWDNETFDIVKYLYSWTLSDVDFVNIDLIVAETEEQALQYLTEKRENSSIPLNLLQPEDQPTIAGNISYGNGSDFIRNNIVIEIHAEGAFNEKTDKIAQQIDALILNSPSFVSLSQVKPVIKDFKITNNPVIERTQTLLILNIEDPNNKEIYYQWNFNTIIGLGGNIIQDDKEDFYYDSNSVYDDLESNEEELTVIAINEYGFCADSTIFIKTVKE